MSNTSTSTLDLMMSFCPSVASQKHRTMPDWLASLSFPLSDSDRGHGWFCWEKNTQPNYPSANTKLANPWTPTNYQTSYDLLQNPNNSYRPSTRTITHPTPVVPRSRLNTVVYSFYPRAIRIWNTIPKDITEIKQPESFQSAISKLTFTTPIHLKCLQIIHVIQEYNKHSGKLGTTLYTTTMEWKPRACLDHPLHLATQPYTNTPSKCKPSTFRNTANIPISVGLHFIQQRWSGNPEFVWIIHYIQLCNSVRLLFWSSRSSSPFFSVFLFQMHGMWSGLVSFSQRKTLTERSSGIKYFTSASSDYLVNMAAIGILICVTFVTEWLSSCTCL